jgi:hypothetical protein
MAEQQGVTRSQIINELSRSAHGKLEEYEKNIGAACKADPEFVSHLIAWDFINGQIKDSKIALPVLTVAHREFPDELIENSLAHIAMQSPRELLKSLRFAIDSNAPARRQKRLERMIRAYLVNRESEPGKWARLAARHRRSLKSLYTLTHTPMPEWGSAALFGFVRDEDKAKRPVSYAPGSIFADIANLSKMDSAQAAAAIQKWHLSPLVVSGAMAGSKAAKESVVVQATMEQMSDTEVITRARSLEKAGLSRDAALKEAFRKKVSKATKSNKATLKTGVAAEEMEDEGLKTMLRELQERQIQAQKDAGRGIEGNWLVIVDRSQSQDVAITLGVHVAAAIAKFVSGQVNLAFCNGDVAPLDVTGKSLEAIQGQAKFVFASGSTSYGIGLQWAAAKGLDLNGVVIVGDGGENTAPFFAVEWREYERKRDKKLPVYLYQTYCDPKYANTTGGNPKNFEMLMAEQRPGHYGLSRDLSGGAVPFTAYDLTHGSVDYYSIPNMVQGMNASRFGVVEKIMACPLLTLEMVFGKLVAV